MNAHEISFTIFYLPATNGKAEESVQKGADMIEQYATLREQEAFEAGYLARKGMQSSGKYMPQHFAYKKWKEATK